VCTYLSSKYIPRPDTNRGINECFKKHKTPELLTAFKSLGPYHVYHLRKALQWETKETTIQQQMRYFISSSCIIITRISLAMGWHQWQCRVSGAQ
jgi:hypothetical protein